MRVGRDGQIGDHARSHTESKKINWNLCEGSRAQGRDHAGGAASGRFPAEKQRRFS